MLSHIKIHLSIYIKIILMVLLKNMIALINGDK